jgi:hypothetical protein
MLKLLMNPWVTAGLSAGLLIAGFIGGWTVRDWKCDADNSAAIEKAAETFEENVNTFNEAAGKFEQTREQIDTVRVSSSNTIREVYKDVEVPADCDVPDAVGGMLDNAINTANAARTGELEQPVPDNS